MGFFDKFKISNIKQEVKKELLSAKQEVVQKFSNTTQKAGQQVSSMFSPIQKSTPVSSASTNHHSPAHPKNDDKRISNIKRIQNGINNCKRFDNDLLIINTRKGCPICSRYNQRIYSISGKHRIYSKIPNEVLNQTHGCKECTWGVSSYYEGITTLKPITKEEMAEMDRRERIKKRPIRAATQIGRHIVQGTTTRYSCKNIVS